MFVELRPSFRPFIQIIEDGPKSLGPLYGDVIFSYVLKSSISQNSEQTSVTGVFSST